MKLAIVFVCTSLALAATALAGGDESCCNTTTGMCMVSPEGTPCPPGFTNGNTHVCDPDPCAAFVACCRANGSCTLVAPNSTAISCMDGTVLANMHTCAPNPCPQPGACCSLAVPNAPAFSCGVMSEAACTILGGHYLGDGTTCQPNSCQPFMGACCSLATPNAPSFMCGVTTPGACASVGGHYLGNGTDCQPNSCRPFVGACCSLAFPGAPGFMCSILTPAACASTGGHYLGDGSDCQPNSCRPFVGACCTLPFPSAPAFECSILTPGACSNMGGHYFGDGSDCQPNSCAPFVGACCTLPFPSAPAFTCSILAPAACSAMSGHYLGDGVLCQPDSCAPFAGGCCSLPFPGAPSLVCTVLAPAACSSMNGHYLGDGTACLPAACMQFVGACCNANTGQCSITTMADCTSGPYQGDGTTCTSGTCAALAGACCENAGGCFVVFQADCMGQFKGTGTACSSGTCVGACCAAATAACTVGGIGSCSGPYQGDGTTCMPDPCAALAGACCDPGGGCHLSLSIGCGGTFQGVGITCSPSPCAATTGACCANDGVCTLTTFDFCDSVDGTFLGPGSVCAADVCDRACCNLTTGVCTLTTITGCIGSPGGGSPQGVGSTCMPDPCPLIEGACCANNGACIVTLPDSCPSADHTFLGVGTVCAADVCDRACCNLTSGACTVTTVMGCIGSPGGGLPQGVGSTCTPDPCPLIEGACCANDGTCIVTTFDFCNSIDHVFLGVGTVCAAGVCNGSCCNLTTGACTVTTSDACVAAPGGGSPQGVGTTCMPDPCPLIEGACCTNNGVCTVTLPDFCPSADHTFFGVGTTCSPSPCTGTTGACCDASGCTLSTSAACTGPGHAFIGNGTVCSPNPCTVLGACCTQLGCALTTPLVCANSDGVYMGGGTSCTPDPCTVLGACCTGSECALATPLVCADGGGVYLGGGSSCTSGVCLTFQGACCAQSGCSVVSADVCTALDGAFQGLGTTCSPNPCTVLGACCTQLGCALTTPFVCHNTPGQFGGGGTTCSPDPCAQSCDISCPGTINSQCGTGVTFAASTSGAGCAGTSITYDIGGSAITSPHDFPQGTTTVHAALHDAAGVVLDECTFSVVVADTMPPTLTCPDPITQCNDSGQCFATVNYTVPSLQDNCGNVPPGAQVLCNLPSGSQFPIGDNIVFCSLFIDGVGTATRCLFHIHVNDCESPTLQCPADIASGTDAGRCDAVVTYDPPVPHDNCSVPVGTVACDHVSGSVFPLGATTVTCTLTGDAGVLANCSFTVTVTDDQGPTLTCRQNAPVQVTGCGPTVLTVDDVIEGGLAGITDNCCTDGFTVSFEPTSFECPPLGVPFPVAVSVTDCNGASSTCSATVVFQGPDCNDNGVADACDICNGTSLDCNCDGIPDDCDCCWDNGRVSLSPADPKGTPGGGPAVNGELSHEGGGAQDASRVADDVYFCPGQVHKVTAFFGQMITNSFHNADHDFRHARLDVFADCDGKPVQTPFKSFTNSVIIASTPLPDGYTLVTYRFDLCDEHLWLDGGTWWFSLIGLSDNVNNSDVSFWAATTPTPNPEGLIGSVPVRAAGTRNPQHWMMFDYGPWVPISDCCLGCVNMAFWLSCETCEVVWDNGPADVDPLTKGGSPSGAAGPAEAETADQFVVKPCEDRYVCLIQAWVWSNCVLTPDQLDHPCDCAFINLYRNDCNLPALETAAWHHLRTTRIIATDKTTTIDGRLVHLYCLEFEENPCNAFGVELYAGQTYWLSAGIRGNGTIATRSYLAYNSSCGPCPIHILPGVNRTISSTGIITDWTRTTHDYAFRISALIGDAVIRSNHGQPGGGGPPACAVDINRDGVATIGDIFAFLGVWFAGCP